MLHAFSLLLALSFLGWGAHVGDRSWSAEDDAERVSMQISAVALMLAGAAISIVLVENVR